LRKSYIQGIVIEETKSELDSSQSYQEHIEMGKFHFIENYVPNENNRDSTSSS
jgi:hypothetical protein